MAARGLQSGSSPAALAPSFVEIEIPPRVKQGTRCRNDKAFLGASGASSSSLWLSPEVRGDWDSSAREAKQALSEWQSISERTGCFLDQPV